MSNPALHEVFDTNFDYHYAAEQRRSGEKGIVQKLGERAVKWFRGMNEKRKAEKAEREYNGSLDEIVPFTTKQPQAVAEPGVYRSNYSDNQPESELTQAETDDIMAHAVARARKNLGALPVITMQEAEKPGADPEDAALLARLEKAFAEPREPDRSDHTLRNPEDDTLVSTKGK